MIGKSRVSSPLARLQDEEERLKAFVGGLDDE
jgi:hypothetical protein